MTVVRLNRKKFDVTELLVHNCPCVLICNPCDQELYTLVLKRPNMTYYMKNTRKEGFKSSGYSNGFIAR